MTLEENLLQALRRHHLAGTRLLVAFSGGADSTALLLALTRLAADHALRVEAAHVNHQLRGEESDRDQEFVRRCCREWDVPLHLSRVDTRVELGRGENLEECARRLRYAFLFETAVEVGAVVLTAHSLNDQAETFLMKLFRGAGPAGLSGVHPVRENRVEVRGRLRRVTVIRPLLEVSRRDIEAYLAGRGQGFCQDSTNQDLGLERNWIRQKLIPLIEERLNPSLMTTLARTAGVFRQVEDFLQIQGERALDRCRIDDESALQLDIDQLERLPPILRKEVIRRAVGECQGTLRGLSLVHVEDVERLLSSESGRVVVLPGGLKVMREFSRLRFHIGEGVAPFSYELKIPGEVLIPELGKRVRAASGEADSAAAVTLRLRQDRLIVRNRRPGDRYLLKRSSRPRKLKELFQRERVPRSQRDRKLVLETEGEIVWVEGLPPHPAHGLSSADSELRTVQILVGHETLQESELLSRQEE